MIGVIANPSEHPAVREFFELFKTPWEFYRSNESYDVILCAAGGDLLEKNARLVVVYGGRKLPFDVHEGLETSSVRESGRLPLYQGEQIPIYTQSVGFRKSPASRHYDGVIDVHQPNGTLVKRIGYDLFVEVRRLLTRGQPVTNAAVPTLELHIALLRDTIVAAGIPLVEIPPVPEGYRFIACLTHDLDHPSIRLHKFDHTMFGFLHRAIVGSVIQVCKRNMSLKNMLMNWKAVLMLPFVHAGLTDDFWLQFNRYTKLDRGFSSFFAIPFKGHPGCTSAGFAPGHRASPYCAADLSKQISQLISAGCEIGLHGIDAWLDSAMGRKELEEIQRVTGMQKTGVRMHWLYFDEQSAVKLDNAGFEYDSTVGYNETIGYRAGTVQVYKPFGSTHLLELPLHVMDTALFSSRRLQLSPREAKQRIGKLVDKLVQFGGVLTVNWHDRSIAPERLWGDFYLDLVEELRKRGAWFATAAQAVAWFRKRRSAVLNDAKKLMPYTELAPGREEDLPGLQVWTHQERSHAASESLVRTTALASE